jgi:arylsulfatase A-like enzyme
VALAITADHGEEFGEHGGWEHGHAVYRELVQVPLLLDLPHASAAAGAVVGTQVRAFDLFPTLLELAGAAVPEDVPARSLLPLASAGAGQASEVASRQDREVVCGHLLDGAYTVGAKGYRDGRFSLVAHDDGRFELYDALRDPAELHDLAPARPETVRALGDLLRRRVAEAERLAAAIPSEAVPVDAGTEEALRGLGYVK